MINNSNTKTVVNGYCFKIVDGKVVADLKANLKGIENITDTTKAVAMQMAKEHKSESELGLSL